MSTYIWGIAQQKFEVKAVYNFIKEYYSDWFPDLPSYQAYNKRICYLADAFKVLAGLLIQEAGVDPEIFTFLLDSLPIIVAGPKRSQTAKAASDICDKGYCASKGLYYYGLKLHFLAQSKTGTLPIPAQMMVTAASVNDLPVGKRMLDGAYNIEVFADKMYRDHEWSNRMKQENNVTIFTPVKLKKGQRKLAFFDKLHSSAVSSVRQPIESFFSWLLQKTHIQSASKVRSSQGLCAFIFARIAFACFCFNY